MSDRVSSSRLRRLGKMAKLARQALPVALERWRDGDTKAEADPRVASEAELSKLAARAEGILETLGEMKGLALKAGQMMSYMDGALPDSIRPTFQRTLKRLQSQAPPMTWEAVFPVLERELGDLEAHFAEIDHSPVAAASIGQVHRARLHDGTVVAVKVQYPGVRDAIAADMKNLDFLKGFAAPIMMLSGAGANMKVAGDHLAELRERLLEECDYAREAEMQTTFRERLADDPELYVPRVYPEHSTRSVLVSEFIEARELDEVCGEAGEALGIDQAQRNRWAEALCRVTSMGLYDWGLLHADPHPGNYLFMDDGRVCLLDFGCVKALPDPIRLAMRGYVSAAIRAQATRAPEDWRRFDDRLRRALRFEDATPEVFKFMRDYLVYCLSPIITPGPFHFSEAFTRATVDLMVEGKKDLMFPDGRRIPKVPKLPPMPADYLMVNRLQWGFFSVLTQLDARCDWHAQLPADMRAAASTSEARPSA